GTRRWRNDSRTHRLRSHIYYDRPTQRLRGFGICFAGGSLTDEIVRRERRWTSAHATPATALQSAPDSCSAGPTIKGLAVTDSHPPQARLFARTKAGHGVFELCGCGGTNVPKVAKTKAIMDTTVQPILWYPSSRTS